MNDFDELTREQLVALTEEEIDGYISRECMKQGVRRFAEPAEPVYREVPGPDLLVYRTSIDYRDAAVFMTTEEANAFLALNPVNLESKYPTGDYSDGHVNVLDEEKHDAGENKITPVQTYSAKSFARAKNDLGYNATAKTAYNKEMETWKKNDEAVNAVLHGINEKIWAAEQEIAREKVVLDIFEEYVELSGGEQETAFRFLQKAFGMEEIKAAFVNNNREVDFGPIGWPEEVGDDSLDESGDSDEEE